MTSPSSIRSARKGITDATTASPGIRVARRPRPRHRQPLEGLRYPGNLIPHGQGIGLHDAAVLPRRAPAVPIRNHLVTQGQQVAGQVDLDEPGPGVVAVAVVGGIDVAGPIGLPDRPGKGKAVAGNIGDLEVSGEVRPVDIVQLRISEGPSPVPARQYSQTQ